MRSRFEEIARFGAANINRAYGDWTTQNLAGWKEHMNQHAIQPIQQFAYTRGKNSTDSSLIIDAMDLLYAGNVDGFYIEAGSAARHAQVLEYNAHQRRTTTTSR